MAHPAQRAFFEKVKKKYPDNFYGVRVIDFGSLDVNGSLKDLFENSEYVGVDIHEGKNVDVISKAHEFDSQFKVDTVVSGEMLEHDEHWLKSLKNMYNQLKSGGLLVFSAAGFSRPEHGTKKTTGDSNLWGTSPDYYKNITVKMIRDEFLPHYQMTDVHIERSPNGDDIYFYGIKK